MWQFEVKSFLLFFARLMKQPPTLLTAGIQTLAVYEKLLRSLTYFNKRAADFEDRSFTLTCYELNGRFRSNTYKLVVSGGAMTSLCADVTTGYLKYLYLTILDDDSEAWSPAGSGDKSGIKGGRTFTGRRSLSCSPGGLVIHRVG